MYALIAILVGLERKFGTGLEWFPPSFQNGFNGSSCNLAYSKALLNVLRFENIDH